MAIRYVGAPALTGPTPQEVRMDEYRQKGAIRSAQQFAQAYLRQVALDDLKRQQGAESAEADELRSEEDRAKAGREEFEAAVQARRAQRKQEGIDTAAVAGAGLNPQAQAMGLTARSGADFGMTVVDEALASDAWRNLNAGQPAAGAVAPAARGSAFPEQPPTRWLPGAGRRWNAAEQAQQEGARRALEETRDVRMGMGSERAQRPRAGQWDEWTRMDEVNRERQRIAAISAQRLATTQAEEAEIDELLPWGQTAEFPVLAPGGEGGRARPIVESGYSGFPAYGYPPAQGGMQPGDPALFQAALRRELQKIRGQKPSLMGPEEITFEPQAVYGPGEGPGIAEFGLPEMIYGRPLPTRGGS
jgi:hypothetical protein